MLAEVLTPNVQELQQDVIELLGEISDLMSRASTALSSDNVDNKYADFEKQIRNETSKVENLELRMAIVAPMKAGKSTIVNAVAGQDILPSRNSAMTTLPTEIIFDAGLNEPILTLSPKVLSVFQKTLVSLRNKIIQLGSERVKERLATYPHLQKMPKLIQELTVDELISRKSEGHKKIAHTLTSLNDIVRLCSILDPQSDPIQYLEDVPRIRTPFWRSVEDNKESKTQGKLVIVDTPGPNEAGENLRLQPVVAEQLAKSSIVLIVLDFTQLKNKAAEKLKEDVQRVIDIRGKDNLYVLVNKVDQRRDGDMNPQEVEDFVAAEFGIGVGDKNRVFEISARRAFTSANFLMELQQFPQAKVAQMNTVRALAQEVFGIDWEEELEDAAVDKLKEKADKLWKKSGFEPFLNDAIAVLVNEAAPRCMDFALKIARTHLVELQNEVKLRNSAVNKDAQKIQNEIELLNRDVFQLEWCLNDLGDEIDSIKKSLQEKLDKTLDKLKFRAEQSIQNYFLDGVAQRIKQVEKPDFRNILEKIDIQVRKTLLSPIPVPHIVSNIFPESVSRFIKYEVGLRGRNECEFKKKEEAEEFAAQLILEATQIVEPLLYQAVKDIEYEIKQSQNELCVLLSKNTKDIIVNASRRLNESFDIKLELPPIVIGSVETDLSTPTVNTVQAKHDFDILKTMGNFFRKLFGYEEVKPNKQNYIVSLEDTVNQFKKSIENQIEQIKIDIFKNIDSSFKNRISAFLNELRSYLKNYQVSLEQALEDQKLSLAKREKVIQILGSFISDTQILAESLEKKQKHTSDLIKKR
ncbi:MAG: dynamin family protein [Rivularia sp. (in: cyanobacteria)]